MTPDANVVTDPGSGRATVAHAVWEVLLLVAAAALLFVVYGKISSYPSSATTLLLTQIAVVGLPAAAISLSLRTGTVNLAVGVIAGGAALVAAKLVVHGWSFWPAAGVAIAAGLVVGVIGALVVGLLDAPGWAVSFALITALTAAVLAATSNAGPYVALTGGGVPSDRTFFTILAIVFVVGSVGAGVLWLNGGIRRAFGGRPFGVRAPIGARLVAALVGFGGASVIAAIGGVGSLVQLRAAGPATSLTLPLLPLAAALLGGASVHGRRGGIAGTVLATAALVAVQQLLLMHNVSAWVTYLVAALAVTLGIAVSAVFGLLDAGSATPLTGYPATGSPYPGGQSGYASGYTANPGYGAPSAFGTGTPAQTQADWTSEDPPTLTDRIGPA